MRVFMSYTYTAQGDMSIVAKGEGGGGRGGGRGGGAGGGGRGGGGVVFYSQYRQTIILLA